MEKNSTKYKLSESHNLEKDENKKEDSKQEEKAPKKDFIKADLVIHDFEKPKWPSYNKLKMPNNSRNDLLKIRLKRYSFIVKLLIMLDFLCPILSDISISIITASFYSNNKYKILYYKNIGKPSEIYINNNRIEDNYRFTYEYENYYLWIRSINTYSNLNIKLKWRSDIWKEIPMTTIITEKIQTTIITPITEITNSDFESNITNLTEISGSTLIEETQIMPTGIITEKIQTTIITSEITNSDFEL